MFWCKNLVNVSDFNVFCAIVGMTYLCYFLCFAAIGFNVETVTYKNLKFQGKGKCFNFI